MHTMMITPELLGLLPNSSNAGGIQNKIILYLLFISIIIGKHCQKCIAVKICVGYLNFESLTYKT